MASKKIPVIGPRITALGEIDFMMAQMSPARQIIPVSLHNCWLAMMKITVKRASNVPAKGNCRL
jgi:hypothetical protein